MKRGMHIGPFVCVLDLAGKIVKLDSKFSSVVGRTKRDLVGSSFTSIMSASCSVTCGKRLVNGLLHGNMD